jgi:cytochrome c peroxidase
MALTQAEIDAATKVLQDLGKQVFFDNISNPPRQSCSTCHVPANGWTGGVAAINKNGVAIPGADPHTVGGRKPPSNAYASFSPPLGSTAASQGACLAGIGPGCVGGVFWDGRAEGRGAIPAAKLLPGGIETVSAAVIPTDLVAAYTPFLGPVADQALGPFPNDVEQNVPDTAPDGGLPGAGAVCQHVAAAKYAPLFKKAYLQDIDCGSSGVATSFKRIALAISAWQHSKDVNSLSSRRDEGARINPSDPNSNLALPFTSLTDQENLGHDLFYGRNDTGRNRLVPNPFAIFGGPALAPKNANCAVCHNNKGGLSAGNEPDQIYSDFAYHHIGVPANLEVENFALNGDAGIGGIATPGVFDPNGPCRNGTNGAGCTTPLAGHFKTPTLRNVDKRRGIGFPKAFMHNGYFKTLEQVVHFYNTSIALRDPVNCPAGTTADQAMARGCWPTAEFDTFNQVGNPIIIGPIVIPGFVGNLGLTADEEAALVAYLKTLTDKHTAKQPAPYTGK